MKIFKSLESGFTRSLKAWKGILLLWLGYLAIVSLVAIPVKGFFNTALSGSMITERLKDGIDAEVLGDIGSGFRYLVSAFPASLVVLILVGIILGVFFSGGIFSSMRISAGRFSVRSFFDASARYFWPFLVITLMAGLIIILLFLVIIVAPISIIMASGEVSEKAPILTIVYSVAAFLLISRIFILVADYARAWQVSQDKPDCFKALGFGFGRTFKTFFTSYLMVLIVFVIQIAFSLLVLYILTRWKPATGGGIFLLFIASQALFIFKLILKVWRYGSVSALKEIKDAEVLPPVETPQIPLA
jgi:hypothetical protein